jgi:trimeric autotransporter adhesin
MRKYLLILGLFLFFPLEGQRVLPGSVASQRKVTVDEGGSSTLLNNILAYYKLEEASGAANDEVGSADLTNSGATQHASGHVNYAASFDGSNDFMGSIDATFEIQAMSVSVWVNTTQTGETSGIVDNYYWTSDGWSVEIGGEWDNNGTAVFHLNDGANELNLYKYPGGTSIRDGNWHLIVATFSGTSANLYVDNTLEATASWNHTITYDAANRFTLGSRSAGGQLYFAGSIDEVGVWTRVLTSDERTELWNSGTGITYPFE